MYPKKGQIFSLIPIGIEAFILMSLGSEDRNAQEKSWKGNLFLPRKKNPKEDRIQFFFYCGTVPLNIKLKNSPKELS